ncbi:MAG: VanZ family protein [Eubacterium sp.]|nr:VanZ family protein [Eubacterium sp.]
MKKRTRVVNIVGRILFVLYMALALYVMFFSESLDREKISENYRYNLVFGTEIRRFWEMRHSYGWNVTLFNVVGNVLCFVPFGFLLPTLSSKRGYKNGVTVTLLAAVFSALVETAQVVARVGAFDVDDIVLNTLGGIIGYIVFVIGRKIIKNR